MNQFQGKKKPVLISADQGDEKTIHVSSNGPLAYGRDRNATEGELETGDRLEVFNHTWVVGRGHLPSVGVLVTTPGE